MSSKRKLPSLGLERRVRARKEEKWEPEPEAEVESSGDEVSEEGVDGGESDADDASENEPASGSEVCIREPFPQLSVQRLTSLV